MTPDLKLIAALLDYPTQLTVDIVEETPDILKSCKMLDDESKKLVLEFSEFHKDTSLLEWQQAYCATFDIAPSTSLYLFEHIYGSSRHRGMAMSSLMDMYAEQELEISNQELPDYLPVYLDFLSRLDDKQEALNYLADIQPILKAIDDVLDKNGSKYALLIKPLMALAAKGEAHPTPEATTECPIFK